MKLTEQQMIKALQTKTISKYSKDEKEQIMNFAFGEDFMKSKNKGELKEYDEVAQMVVYIKTRINGKVKVKAIWIRP